MWSVFFLFLSYLDVDFAKGELSSLDGKKENHVSYLLLNATACVDDSACRVGLSPQKTDDGKSKSVSQENEDTKYPPSDIQTLRRSKRGFTYPGTLWCGAGNIADNYDQLGEFAETDKCCRTHDHCPHVIHSFSSKYGFTNFKWHSISHCDCDNVMQQCLRAVNDTSSRVVGQAFFNVIEAPCFEFSLEQQCVERYWYGVCKRYDKVPVAVIKESVPYDFGGIEVIDVLTVAPSMEKIPETNEDNQEKIQRLESTTQSSTSESKNPAPEEPSLKNVVTAAEDFIKVLATVSTSQSSSTEGGNTGETPASDKKRKKNAGKKKKDSKKRRGKGKEKKKKQNTNKVPRNNGSVTGVPSDNKAEEINKKPFVEDSGNFRWVSKNDNFMNSQFSSVENIKHANAMMRDEHQRTPDKSRVSITTAPHAKHEAKMFTPQKKIKDIEYVQLFSAVPLTLTSKPTTAIPRQSGAKKRQRHPTPTFLPIKGTTHNMMADNTVVSTSESTSLAGLTTHTPISLPGEEAPYNIASQHEKGPAFNATTQNTSIVGTKRLRLRHKGGRRKSRKLHSPSSLTDSLTTEAPALHLTETIQELTVGPCRQPQCASEQIQSNGPKNRVEKATAGVSGEIHLKIFKGIGARKRARQPKSHSSIMKDAIMVTSTSAGSTDLATQGKDAVANTGQLSPSRLQTITPSMPPPKTSKSMGKKSKKKDGKSRRKNKGTNNFA